MERETSGRLCLVLVHVKCDLSSSRCIDESDEDVSVQDLINSTFEAEKLERKCLHCSSSYAWVKTDITQLPRVFVIYLKRHKYSKATKSNSKSKTKVVIPPTISVAALVEDNFKSPAELSEQEIAVCRESCQASFSTPAPARRQRPRSPSIPDKFRSLSPAEAVKKLSEEEQLEYTLHLSLLGNDGDSCSPLRKRKKLSEGESGESPMQEVAADQPQSPEEEEEHLRRALISSLIGEESFLRLIPPCSKNNNNKVGSWPGLQGEDVDEKLLFQLQSVVSHHGTSATTGHYVADVFRFDVGGWIRYDDDKVSRTTEEAVVTGSNTYNGYILTYLHRPLWTKMVSKV